MKIKNSELKLYKHCLSMTGNSVSIPAAKILKVIEAKDEVVKHLKILSDANNTLISQAGINPRQKDITQDEKWATIEPKLQEINELEVELVHVNFMTKEEVVEITRGQNMSVTQFLLKYLSIQ